MTHSALDLNSGAACESLLKNTTPFLLKQFGARQGGLWGQVCKGNRLGLDLKIEIRYPT
jgi:hypothetical protein